MRELEVDVRRVGPMTPLEVQLRRVITRSEFLRLELEKLAELVDAGGRIDAGWVELLGDHLEELGRIAGRIRRDPDRQGPTT